MRIVAIALFAAIAASAQQGAKALFHDTSSNNSIQSSRQGTKGGTTKKAPAPAPPDKGGLAGGGVMLPISAPQVTGVMYWVELMTDKGQLLRVNTSRPFQTGERIRIHVISNVDGRLSILQSEDGSPFSVLFPGRSTDSGFVRAEEETVLPSRTAWFRFDNKPGDIRLLLMVNGANAPGTPSAPGNNNLMAAADEKAYRDRLEQLRGSKALVVEEDTSATTPATYIVADARNKNVPPGVVATEIKLLHATTPAR